MIVTLAGCDTEAERSARATAAARERANWEAEAKAQEVAAAEAEKQLKDDIEACSTVVDPSRCREAFWCRQNPEDCVYEFGDPSSFFENYDDADQEPGDGGY